MLPSDFESIYVIICPLCNGRIKVKAAADPNQVWETHSLSPECKQTGNQVNPKTEKCAAKKCYTKLTVLNKYQCPNCLQNVCLTHRFPDDHQCTNIIPEPKEQHKSKLLQPDYFKNPEKYKGDAWRDPAGQPVINHFDYTNLENHISRFSS